MSPFSSTSSEMSQLSSFCFAVALCPVFAEVLHDLAGLIVENDAAVDVAIADKHVSRGTDRDVCRLVEMFVVFARLTLRAERQQQLAVGSELAHGVIAVVSDPDIAVLVEPDLVRISKDTLS